MSHSDGPDREYIFRSVYEAVYPDVLRFVQRRAPSGYAEDVVAETFLVVWRRLDVVPRVHDDARAWIFGIARNIVLNHNRGEERRRALSVRLADVEAPSTASTAEGVVSRVDLARAWRRLSATHQEALALTVFEELSAPQAGAVLGISPVAFRLRLSRARRALRAHLDYLPNRAGTPAHVTTERTSTP